MGLIDQLFEKIKNSKDSEKEAVDFLNHTYFGDEAVKSQAEQYVSHILNDVVKQNKELSPLEAKIIHCILAKMTLAQLNLDNIEVKYLDRPNNSNAGAFYRNNTINFFNQSVCNKEEFLLPYGKDSERGGRSRLNYFVNELFKLEHEIQHAVQFESMNASTSNPEQLSVDDYIISRQYVARLFATAENSKYYKQGLNADRLYYDNHNQFYYEIDADLKGMERTLSLLNNLSKPAYDLAVDEKIGWKFLSKIEEKQEQIDNYGDVAWSHNTNPKNLKVSANHKASMIVDNILPLLDNKQREEFMRTYPALHITYNRDGSKKSLEQIEREFFEKKNKILTNGTDEQVSVEVPKLEKLQIAVIESDPLLSFEKCLQHIARMTWDEQRYYTDSGIEEKYNPKYIGAEIKMAREKATKIAEYFEESQAKSATKILDKYKKEISNSRKHNARDLRFFEQKKLAIFDIEGEINANKIVHEVIKKDFLETQTKRRRQRQDQTQARQIIEKVFPTFQPSPQVGTLKDGSVELLNNSKEQLILMEAYREYIKTIISQKKSFDKDKDFVPSGVLLSAIKTLYNFTPSEEEKSEFMKALNNGEIDVIENKYQSRQNKGAYSQSEIESVEGRSYSFKSITPQVKRQEESTKFEDPEADGEQGFYRSQRKENEEVELDEYGVPIPKTKGFNDKNFNQDIEFNR